MSQHPYESFNPVGYQIKSHDHCRSLEPVRPVDEKEKDFNEEYDRGKTKKVKGMGQANTWSTGEDNLFTKTFISRKRGKGGRGIRSPVKGSSLN